VVAPDDWPRACGEREGEVELNSSPNPSRLGSITGRVISVTETAKKKPPVIAILALVIPLAGLAIAGVMSSASDDHNSAPPTTLVQDGDAERAGTKASDAKDGSTTEAPSTTPPGRPNESGGASSGGGGESTDEAEVPSRPQDAGPEGDRPTVTYPQPTMPAGGCKSASGTAVITLDAAPSPRCVRLSPDQPVVVRNRTGKEISVVAIGLNEVVASGKDMRVGRAIDAFGDGQSTFWSPGNPKLSGIVQVG